LLHLAHGFLIRADAILEFTLLEKQTNIYCKRKNVSHMASLPEEIFMFEEKEEEEENYSVGSIHNIETKKYTLFSLDVIEEKEKNVTVGDT
jgi:hypothetical protein